MIDDVYSETVIQALIQDAQVVTEAHYAGAAIDEEMWAGLYASISAVRALLPAQLVVPIPEHLRGRIWRVIVDHTGQPRASLATDDSVVIGALLVVAESAEQAIARTLPA
jgi:hypothetical protein